ncbi:YebC/PmpR family DNA-binding transcriptional regulator [Burkholderia gladioli]|uniref:YebC/PmpR family DNA-binding transcriptional regulator n=1 Tax=Burkholderia gladioli TaxID=28095 RepID=UPI003D1AE91D
MTDNRVRTVAEVRTRSRSTAATWAPTARWPSCSITSASSCSPPGTSEDALMEAALEAGADDVNTNEDGSIEVLCDWQEFSKVKDALEAAGFKAELAEVTMKPQNEVEFSGDDAVKMQKLLDVLEDLDDVQEVYTNALIVDE